MTKKRKSLIGWCLYDAANTAFGTVIITFVFSVYFARSVVGDETLGSAWWGYAIAASGFLIAVSGPLCGALADHYGGHKRFVLGLSAGCILATALMYIAVPDAGAGMILLVLALLVLANTLFELSLVFANAMLPSLAPAGMMGRISGWAWACGYFGALICLVLVLVGFVGLGDMTPLIDLPQDMAQNVRASAPATALWYALMAVPFLLWTPDIARTGLGLFAAAKAGLAELWASVRQVKTHRNLVMFLCGSALYRDGLNTLFAMGGLYAAGVYDMSFSEILIFAIGLNVTAGLGAGIFAFMDDRLGSRPTILFALGGLMATGVCVLLTADKFVFIGLALLLGLFIGPAQAAGRTLAARLAPEGQVTQTYGLYAFTGKSIAFLGPICYGLATSIFDDQRAGMATILMFWAAGFILIKMVKEKTVP